MKKILSPYIFILSLLMSFPAFAADSTTFNPVPIVVQPVSVSFPIGVIVAWPVGSLPPMEGGSQKWAECNGQTLPQAAYPGLFAALGTTTLPDLRGEFVRGWDHGRGADPDSERAIRSSQDRTVGELYSPIGLSSGRMAIKTSPYAWGAGSSSPVAPSNSQAIGGTVWSYGSYNSPTAVKVEESGTSDTRPRNVALMYVIRVLP